MFAGEGIIEFIDEARNESEYLPECKRRLKVEEEEVRDFVVPGKSEHSADLAFTEKLPAGCEY